MTPRMEEQGALGKLFALVAGGILLVLGFMFSVVLLTLVAVAGVCVFGYFLWKTRALRKVMRERSAAQADRQGTVIDGEAVIVEGGAQTGQIPVMVESRERQP